MEDPVKKSLPARPNLDHLRSQAKELLAKLRDGDAAAARMFIDHLPAARTMSPADVVGAGFRLADAQSAIARQAGFAAWPGLARHVEQLRAWEGEWRFVSLAVDGQTVPVAMLGEARLLVDGDRFRMDSAEGAYEGVFIIDVDADPPQIDIDFVEGPEAGQRAFGIFHLDDDRLEICLGVVGATRPERFVSTPGSGHALERLRRSSAARPEGVDGGTKPADTDAAPAAPAPSGDESAFALHLTPLLAALQGDWTPTALVNAGSPLQEKMLAFGSRTIAGNDTRVVFGGQVMVHARMRIDESSSPIAVDYLAIGTPRSISHGVLEFDGEILRICMAPAGAPRPAAFISTRENRCLLSEWRRR